MDKIVEEHSVLISTLENELSVEIKQKANYRPYGRSREYDPENEYTGYIVGRNAHYTVNKEGYITLLSLENCNIKSLSSIINIVEKISTLESLILARNIIKSIRDIAKISSLIFLSVDSNEITNISYIKKLKKLRFLEISNNPIERIDYLLNLNYLEELIVSNCSLQNLDFVRELKSLRVLNASSNSITDLSFLSDLDNLSDLYLDNNVDIDYDTFQVKESVRSLYLTHNQIDNITFLSKFKNLIQLNLSNNNINDISSWPIIDKLTYLDLDYNNIENASPLFHCSNLISLRLIKNKINNLNGIEVLKKIEILIVNENYLEDLSIFSKIPTLKTLFTAKNKIEKIDGIKNNINLSRLNLGGNSISDIEPLKNLINLVDLYLYNNKIKNLEPIKLFVKLKHLWMTNNLVEALPTWITDLNLKIMLEDDGPGKNGISLSKNPIKFPPVEIVKQGNDAIKNYFSQLQQQEEEYIFEAKLLILGEPGAGKTSMAWKIENYSCELPNEEDTTRGIEVKQYYFPIRKEDYPNIDLSNALQDKSFRVNVWDFGGQEIYKATHRFFLSKRSLYTLVTDTRNENTDFNYWLHIVEMFGGSSPLLIVINEKNNRKRTIDISLLKRRFNNIVDVIEIDLSKKDPNRIDLLLKEIRHYATKLEHVGSPVPAKWIQVREIIESNGHNTITVQDYIALCATNGIGNKSDALLLSQYFHDIGVFLHFQDDELLKRTIFLKPNWATNSIYKILDHPLLDEQNGRFTLKDSKDIWYAEEYEFVHSELLQLMKKFFLAYKVSNLDEYIVPEKLPDVQPDYEWDREDNIFLRYDYDIFMPKGIISQFIVQMNDNIFEQKYVWRRGVLLKRGEALAEVIETYDERNIKIRISGKEKRDFLIIIMYEIDKINSIYEKIKLKKMIPCNCHECRESLDQPFFYEYDVLKKRVARGRYEIECEISYTMVNVNALINDVTDDSKKEKQEITDQILINSFNSLSMKKKRIFISYSHKDSKWLEKIQTRFEALNNLGVTVDAWDDTKLRAGTQWREEITEAIDNSDLSVLLISDHFLASKFIMENELPPLLRRKEKYPVIPVIVRPSMYSMHDELQKIQSFNPPSKALSEMRPSAQDRYFVDLMGYIKQVLA